MVAEAKVTEAITRAMVAEAKVTEAITRAMEAEATVEAIEVEEQT